MTPNDDAFFIEALYADPTDDMLRLAYAEWLDRRGRVGAAVLRAEVQHFQQPQSWDAVRHSVLWTLMTEVDPVCAATVTRAPFGILVPGLTFRDTGPIIERADLREIEGHWGEPLPADFAAFLLRYNGGRPSKPYLWSPRKLTTTHLTTMTKSGSYRLTTGIPQVHAIC